MIKQWKFSIRWKLMLATMLSVAITGVVLFVVQTLAISLIQSEPYSNFIKWGINKIGSGLILSVVGLSIFIASYMILSRSVMQDIQQVEKALKQIEEGDFRVGELIHSRDEIGMIGAHIQEIASELNSYMEDMNQGLNRIAEGLLDHTIPVKPNHKLGEVAASINEMTQQLNRSMQEERLAEQSKNDLITGVSHDLRTPLTSILGFLEVVKQGHYRDEVEMMHYVDIAHSKTTQLKRLIDDLFEYTRMKNGMPLRSEPLALDDFLQQFMDEYVPIMDRAGLVGRLIIEHRRVRIAADGELIVRAFSNIIHNAMQYGKNGTFIDVTLRAEHKQAIVTIANYGSPIPASDLPFVFDRFYRIDKSRSLETGGTGLGLAICRSIVELHQGSIHAESDSHRTAFKLCFPILDDESR